MSQLGRLTGLQWGRGVAAASVVLGHAIGYYELNLAATLIAKTGVTLFFVISGFIMVATTGIGRFNPIRFAIKRYLRVAPLYYIATLTTAAAALIVPFWFQQTTFNISHIIWSMLFVPVRTPDTGAIEPFMKLGWTLNFEMFFYACFALLFWLTAVQRAVVLTVLFTTLVAIGTQMEFSFPPLEFYTWFDITGFIGGVWVGIAWVHAGPAIQGRVSGPMLVALSVALLGVLGATIYKDIRDDPASTLLFVAICSITVGGLAIGFKGQGSRIWRPLTLIGDASYSIYLFHMFALGISFQIVKRLLPVPPAVLIPIATIAGILAGVIVYTVVERHLTRLIRVRSRTYKEESTVLTSNA